MEETLFLVLFLEYAWLLVSADRLVRRGGVGTLLPSGRGQWWNYGNGSGHWKACLVAGVVREWQGRTVLTLEGTYLWDVEDLDEMRGVWQSWGG